MNPLLRVAVLAAVLLHPLAATPVINEFHYNPAGNTSLEEFIELHNPGAAALDLSGWSLADAVAYTFPDGTVLPAGGYLVVAENPAVLLAKFGTTALGPWTGKLSSRGERIDLRDAAGVLSDRVNYGAGFPWPTAADGGGSSAELQHPGLDNDLGGSWRSSGSADTPPVTYIAAQATGWKYKKGTAEASSPVDAWRTLAYDDTTWFTGQTGIGYNDPGVNTTLGDMRAAGGNPGYASVYFRKTFTVASNSIPGQLRLRVRIDDGCVIWINGTEVDRRYVGSGQLAHNYLAPANHDNTNWDEVVIGNADALLVGGTNVIAVHGFNTTLGSSDFSLDLELASATAGAAVPTPGTVNSVAKAATAIAPQIRQVAHAPPSPAAGQAVTLTARVTDPDGVGSVTLAYQTVDPGSFIRRGDAAYATSWTTVTMRDNGLNGDLLANDSTYTVRLPASVQTHRRLVRYRITVTDSLGNNATVPYLDDEQPNFAYFVYNGSPAWNGALSPGSSPVQTYPAPLLESLPPLQIIANATDINSFQAGSDTRFDAAVVHRGVVHDHVQFRVRGIGSTTVSGKNKWNIYFNRSRDYQAYDNLGIPYKETWNNLLINANSSPWAAVNRGSAGVEEAACNRIYGLAGMAAMHTHFLHLRVIDEAAEATSGDLWGLYLGLEPTEGNFLDERDLPDGNLYSIEGNGGDKKHQGPTQPLDSSDWIAFRASLAASGQTEAWYRANVDLPALYTFLALNRLTGNVDVRPGDNYRFYHRPTDNRWVIIPYDLDMQFIAAHHWGGSMDGVTVAGAPNVIRAIMRHPEIAREFRNRCRELLSLMASDGSPNGGQIGQLIDEYAKVVNPAGLALTWADLDAAMWNLNPKTRGTLGATSGQSNHRGNFFRATYLDGSRGVGGTVSTGSWIRSLPDPDGNGLGDHEGMMQWFVNYATDTWPGGTWLRKATSESGGGTDSDPNRQRGYGYKYLEWESLYGGYANANTNPGPANLRNDFPNQPVVSFTGDPAFPVSDLSFASSAFADPQGPATRAAWQWRIAEISAPGIPGHVAGRPRKYEIEPLLTSAELNTAPGSFTIPYGLTQPGRTYRVRVRHQDSSGNWSRWSDPAQVLTTPPPPGPLLHYWNFNAADPANLLDVTTTVGGGTLTPVLTGTAATLADDGQSFAAENARNGDPAGTHLRLNNPLGATVDFALPTRGHDKVVVKYETRRSGQGAGRQVVSYSVDGSGYLPFATFEIPDGTPVVQILDFRGIPAASDNPLFALRITFQQGAGGSAGNNRFDNFTVEGEVLETVIQPGTFTFWRDQHFPAPADFANEALSGPEAAPAGDGVANIIRYAHGVGPYDPVVHLLPVLVADGGGRQFRFRHDPALTDLVWKVTASNDLGSWPATLFDSTVGPVPPLDHGWLPVTLPASLTGNPAPDPRIFARLELRLAP